MVVALRWGRTRKPEMANAVEFGWQGVQQDAADELFGRQRHGLPSVLLPVVLPADSAVGDGEDALVGDRHAVGVGAPGRRAREPGPRASTVPWRSAAREGGVGVTAAQEA